MLYTQEEFQKRYRTLSPELREAIRAHATAEATYEIGTANNLDISEIGILADQTGYVMVGMTRPDAFVGALKRSLHRDDVQINKIATSINNQIFLPIRGHLQRLHEHNTPEDQKKNAQATTPVTTTAPIKTNGAATSAPKTAGAPVEAKRDDALVERLLAKAKANQQTPPSSAPKTPNIVTVKRTTEDAGGLQIHRTARPSDKTSVNPPHKDPEKKTPPQAPQAKLLKKESIPIITPTPAPSVTPTATPVPIITAPKVPVQTKTFFNTTPIAAHTQPPPAVDQKTAVQNPQKSPPMVFPNKPVPGEGDASLPTVYDRDPYREPIENE